MPNNVTWLIELAKTAARAGLGVMNDYESGGNKNYSFATDWSREAKAEADIAVELVILEHLKVGSIEILSEESGSLAGAEPSTLSFVVDPIDGTVNFVRGIGSCSVSIALMEGSRPVFGVIASFPSGELYWGGREFGAFSDSGPLRVSSVKEKSKAVFCTGFPSRFQFDSQLAGLQLEQMERFGKTRMLGSASQSLLMIAKGAAECYWEHDIMLWDVAAGIAIVEGAGGRSTIVPGSHNLSLTVAADNNLVTFRDWQEVDEI